VTEVKAPGSDLGPEGREDTAGEATTARIEPETFEKGGESTTSKLAGETRTQGGQGGEAEETTVAPETEVETKKEPLPVVLPAADQGPIL
jgi:hypothetical protein